VKGFWEECLMRAVPIAGAVLIGRQFGFGTRERASPMVVWGVVLFQSLVFGAAHANYPAQPAYARLVELVIPSIGFAVLSVPEFLCQHGA
jgi:membrane protease YdiL (CAAX protease family)